MLEVRPSTSTGSPPITQITFPACRAHYPGGPGRCLSVSSLSARPSPVNRRVGIHNFTFGACSSFTRVTACRIACPPKRRTLSRGFDPASYPTVPLGSYHVSPTTTWWILLPLVICAVGAHSPETTLPPLGFRRYGVRALQPFSGAVRLVGSGIGPRNIASLYLHIPDHTSASGTLSGLACGPSP